MTLQQVYGCQRITRNVFLCNDLYRIRWALVYHRFRIRLTIRVQCALHHKNDVNLKFCRDTTHSRVAHSWGLCTLGFGHALRHCKHSRAADHSSNRLFALLPPGWPDPSKRERETDRGGRSKQPQPQTHMHRHAQARSRHTSKLDDKS